MVAAALLALLPGLSPLARANGLTISPVVVEIDAPRKAAAITITNRSDRPITLQTDIRAWRQVEGIDQYASTDELLVVPAIAQVPPNSSQVFRVALRRPSGAPVERTYRLILEDISDEQQPSGGNAIAFRFTHNLPVMVAPSLAVVNAVRWMPCAPRPVPSGSQSANSTQEGSLACVRVHNAGNRRVKVQSLTLAGDGWQQVWPLTAPESILAGDTREWRVPLPAARAAAVRRLQVHTAQGATLQAEGESLQANGKSF
jgi:fimbrial chaperone protein